jgi:hypothetical protein
VSLTILSSRRRRHRCHLRHGQHDEERSEADDECNPDGTSGTAVSEGEDGQDEGEFPCQAQHHDISDDGEESKATFQFCIGMDFVS